jgi:hypothetical protein
VFLFFQLCFGLGLGYLLATLAESWMHKNVLHASADTRRMWRRRPRLFASFRRAYYSHHVIHHARTYRQDFVTQFRSEQERAQLDRAIPSHLRARIQRERYGTTLSGVGVLLFLLPIAPLLPLVYLLFGPWVFLASLVPLVVVYPLLSLWMHPLLHLPRALALSRTSVLGAWVLRTAYVKTVVCNHYLHHRYLTCNFNLLLGGDYLLGYSRAPSMLDREEMIRLGLLQRASSSADPAALVEPPANSAN